MYTCIFVQFGYVYLLESNKKSDKTKLDKSYWSGEDVVKKSSLSARLNTAIRFLTFLHMQLQITLPKH